MKKTTEKNERQLKINREVKKVGRYHMQKDKRVPSLKLSGDWFREAGFEIGKHVKIKVEKGKLIIEALK